MPTRADSPIKTCSSTGCSKAQRARGLCSTHYNQQHQPNRHAGYVITCVTCKAEHRSARRDGRYCSEPCRAIDYRLRGIAPKVRGYPWTRRRWALARTQAAARGTRGRRWFSGRCARCARQFIAPSSGGSPSIYCSDACSRAARASRRRARRRGAETDHYSRLAIFERDAWRCHICRRKVRRQESVPHPLAPTIDHLVPLAMGGSDTAANVATAHFICNSTKGERAGSRGDQLALLG